MAWPDSTPIKLAIRPSLRAASVFYSLQLALFKLCPCSQPFFFFQVLFTNIAAGDGPLEVVGILGDHLLDDIDLLHEQLHRVSKLRVAADVR